jgi:hypothetical protein
MSNITRVPARRSSSHGSTSQSLNPVNCVAILTLVVKECRDGRFEACLDGTIICRSRTPLLTSARVLLRQGYDPNSIISMRVDGSATTSMRMHLGAAANLTVEEGRGSPRFVRYRPPANKRGQEVRGYRPQTAISHASATLVPDNAPEVSLNGPAVEDTQ